MFNSLVEKSCFHQSSTFGATVEGGRLLQQDRRRCRHRKHLLDFAPRCAFTIRQASRRPFAPRLYLIMARNVSGSLPNSMVTSFHSKKCQNGAQFFKNVSCVNVDREICRSAGIHAPLLEEIDSEMASCYGNVWQNKEENSFREVGSLNKYMF